MTSCRIAGFVCLIGWVTGLSTVGAAQAIRESSFGKYQGYSDRRFDSFIRQSEYVAGDGGTRLAIDILRPAVASKPASEPLPVALQVTRYWRSNEMGDGSVATIAGVIPSGQNWAALANGGGGVVVGEILRRGYVVIVMDSRGTGASFGVQSQLLQLEARDVQDLIEARDMRHVIEWAASQPWSTGKVGMFGGSWPGIIQLFATMAKPPSLKAVFPAVPNFPDFYRIFQPGGVYLKGSALTMRKVLVGLTDVKDQGQAANQPARDRVVGPSRVDEDKDGSLRVEARAGHGAASFAGYVDDILNHPIVKEVASEIGLHSIDQTINTLFYADSLDRALRGHDALRRKLAEAQWPQRRESYDLLKVVLDKINASGVPVYLWDGWQDPSPAERLLYYYNLTVPTRITIGPWSHGADEPNDPREDAHLSLMGIEIVRWFDRWLKSIPNGIEREPRVNYAVMQDRSHWEWRTARTIPPPEASMTSFFFALGKSGSIRSTNDGLLTLTRPRTVSGSDDYVADYSMTTGNHTRLHDATGGGPIAYPDLSPNDAKGLTYTTPPLTKDVVVAGFPVLTLHVSSTARDPLFVAYLEDIGPDGYSTLVTQGFIRASHRTPRRPPYSTNGTPWTSSLARDVDSAAPLTAGPARIQFALQPVAKRFSSGQRIRLTIGMSDEGLVWVVPQSPRPGVTVWRDKTRPSRLSLPVISDARRPARKGG